MSTRVDPVAATSLWRRLTPGVALSLTLVAFAFAFLGIAGTAAARATPVAGAATARAEPGAVAPIPAGPGCLGSRVGHSRLLVGEITIFDGCGFGPGTAVEIASGGRVLHAVTADGAGRVSVPVSFASPGVKVITARGVGVPPAVAAESLPARSVGTGLGLVGSGQPLSPGTPPVVPASRTLSATVVVIGLAAGPTGIGATGTGAADATGGADPGAGDGEWSRGGDWRPPQSSGLTPSDILALLALLQSQSSQRGSAVVSGTGMPGLGAFTLGDLLGAEEEAEAEEAEAVAAEEEAVAGAPVPATQPPVVPGAGAGAQAGQPAGAAGPAGTGGELPLTGVSGTALTVLAGGLLAGGFWWLRRRREFYVRQFAGGPAAAWGPPGPVMPPWPASRWPGAAWPGGPGCAWSCPPCQPDVPGAPGRPGGQGPPAGPPPMSGPAPTWWWPAEPGPAGGRQAAPDDSGLSDRT